MKKYSILVSMACLSAVFVAYSGNPISSVNFQRVLDNALYLRGQGDYRGAGRALYFLTYDPSRISQFDTPSAAIVDRARTELEDMTRLGQFNTSMLQDTELDRLRERY